MDGSPTALREFNEAAARAHFLGLRADWIHVDARVISTGEDDPKTFGLVLPFKPPSGPTLVAIVPLSSDLLADFRAAFIAGAAKFESALNRSSRRSLKRFKYKPEPAFEANQEAVLIEAMERFVERIEAQA